MGQNEKKQTNAGKDVGENISYTAGRVVISATIHSVESGKLKLELTYDPAVALLGIYPCTHPTTEILTHSSSLLHCSQEPRHGTSLVVFQEESG